jgi:hypothetical protein
VWEDFQGGQVQRESPSMDGLAIRNASLKYIW